MKNIIKQCGSEGIGQMLQVNWGQIFMTSPLGAINANITNLSLRSTMRIKTITIHLQQEQTAKWDSECCEVSDEWTWKQTL